MVVAGDVAPKSGKDCSGEGPFGRPCRTVPVAHPKTTVSPSSPRTSMSLSAASTSRCGRKVAASPAATPTPVAPEELAAGGEAADILTPEIQLEIAYEVIDRLDMAEERRLLSAGEQSLREFLEAQVISLEAALGVQNVDVQVPVATSAPCAIQMPVATFAPMVAPSTSPSEAALIGYMLLSKDEHRSAKLVAQSNVLCVCAGDVQVAGDEASSECSPGDQKPGSYHHANRSWWGGGEDNDLWVGCG